MNNFGFKNAKIFKNLRSAFFFIAPETEKDRSGIIPFEKLDEVFEIDPNPKDGDIYAANEIDLEAEEELEQSNRVEGRGVMLAEELRQIINPKIIEDIW